MSVIPVIHHPLMVEAAFRRGPHPLFALIALLILLAVVVALTVFFTQRRAHPVGFTRAREILSERFARGEIDESEYRKRLEVLAS